MHLSIITNRFFLPLFFLMFLWTEGFLLRIFEPLGRPDFRFLRISSVFIVVGVAFLSLCGHHQDARNVLFRDFYFKIIVAIIMAASFSTLMTGTLLYGQSPVEIFRSTMSFYGMFVMILLFWAGWSSHEKILNSNRALVATGIIISVLGVAMSFFPAQVHELFTIRMPARVRFGDTTVGVGGADIGPFVSYAGAYLLARIYFDAANGLKQSYSSISALVIVVYYRFFLTGSRALILALLVLVALFVAVSLMRGVVGRDNFAFKAFVKTFAVIGVIVLMAVIISNTFTNRTLGSIVYGTIEQVSEETEHGEGTVGRRMEGMAYYFAEFRNTGWVGVGHVSRARSGDNPLTVVGYNIRDQGWLGFFFRYGFPGVLILALYIRRLFIDWRLCTKYVGWHDGIIVSNAIFCFVIFEVVSNRELFFHPGQALLWGVVFFMQSALTHIAKYEAACSTPYSPIQPLRNERPGRTVLRQCNQISPIAIRRPFETQAKMPSASTALSIRSTPFGARIIP